MPTKRCSTCKQSKPLDAFVLDARKRDGRGARCRECHNAACHRYVAENPDVRLESSRRYYRTHREEHAVLVMAWKERNPETVRAIQQRTRAKHPHAHRTHYRNGGLARLRAERARNRQQYRARNKVNNAIARGALPRARDHLCTVCGEQAREYHHHRGYDERHWLDVVPVCRPCHRRLG